MADLTPNPEQVKTAFRTLLTAFAGFIGGVGVSKGWYTVDQFGQFLNSETVSALITTLAVGAWGVWTRTSTNIALSAKALPEIKGLVTTNTEAGHALARAIPTSDVAVAGTNDAAAIASSTPKPIL